MVFVRDRLPDDPFSPLDGCSVLFDLGRKCCVECLSVEVIWGERLADRVSCWLGPDGDCPVAVLLLEYADGV